jgi:uncharacterized membrane protein
MNYPDLVINAILATVRLKQFALAIILPVFFLVLLIVFIVPRFRVRIVTWGAPVIAFGISGVFFVLPFLEDHDIGTLASIWAFGLAMGVLGVAILDQRSQRAELDSLRKNLSTRLVAIESRLKKPKQKRSP